MMEWTSEKEERNRCGPEIHSACVISHANKLTIVLTGAMNPLIPAVCEPATFPFFAKSLVCDFLAGCLEM